MEKNRRIQVRRLGFQPRRCDLAEVWYSAIIYYVSNIEKIVLPKHKVAMRSKHD